MGYMKGLNQWLERDVRNRREEFQDVFQTVEELRRQIRGMRKKRARGDRERNRRDSDDRRMPRSRTRSERPETTIRVDRLPASSGPSAPVTPVDFVPQPAAPQPQRWTAIPALIQPLPVHPQQKQNLAVPYMVPANSSRTQGSSRMPFVPAAFVQRPIRSRAQQQAQPSTTHLQSQPTIILLPAGTRAPGQTAQAGMHPVGWQYPENRNERLVRNGGRSRR